MAFTEEKQDYVFHLTILGMILFNLLDLATTYIGILAGGYERNPLMADMMQESWGHAIFAKVISTMFVIIVLAFAWSWVKKLKKENEQFIGRVVVLVFSIILTLSIFSVVVSNFKIIVRLLQ